MRMAVLHGSSGTARLLFASRPANASDYLAAGKLRCGRCDKRYVGAAARRTSRRRWSAPRLCHRPRRVLADFRANIRAAVDIDEIAPKKAVISALVQDVDVRSRNEIYPTFRFPTAAELDGKVRKLSGSMPQLATIRTPRHQRFRWSTARSSGCRA